MFCTNCGNEIKEGAMFCTKCGTPAPKAESAPVVETPNPTPTPASSAPKKKGNGLIIAIIAIIIALVLGGGAYVLVSSGVIDFGEIFSSKDKDDEDDDKNKDDEDDEKDKEDDTSSSVVEDTEDDLEDARDAYGLVVFEDADEAFIADVLSVYENYCNENEMTEVTLFYYNGDNIPELYCHQDDVLVFVTNEDGDWEEIAGARSTLLVYGHNVTTFVKSAHVEDAYLVLTDPNYMLENADYILPTSNTEYLTKEDLAGLTKEQLRIARNEIFARHGRMFDSEDLQEYFDSKEWYTGTIPADEFNLEEILNDIEKANADLIKEVEAEMEN